MNATDKNHELVSKFNKSFDYDILLLLYGEILSIEEKKYLVEHRQNRIEQMDTGIFLRTMRQTDQVFCEACNQYISSKIPTLSVSQVEKLLYVNKYYHKVSELAKFLVKQDWFQTKKMMNIKLF